MTVQDFTNQTQFVEWMADYILRNSDMNSHWQALSLAESTLQSFLKESRIGFGSPGYSWDKGAAQTLVDEFVFAYAESRR